MDRIFDHTHAAQMAAEFYGPQRGIVLRTDTGIFGRVAAANLLLAPVGISDAADDAYGVLRDLQVVGPAFPTRRSSDLPDESALSACGFRIDFLSCFHSFRFLLVLQI